MKFAIPTISAFGLLLVADSPAAGLLPAQKTSAASLAAQFANPPDSARPGVYWYFLDGNRTQAAMTAELEIMARSGLGSALIQEVDLGIPRGPVNFMSDAWEKMFVQTVRDAERLGLEIMLGSGPGWAGSGGPWVKPEESMQHLVASSTAVIGPVRFSGTLPLPSPKKPYFETLSPELKARRDSYYRDVAVLAFPTPTGTAEIKDIDEKALYYRPPYTSRPAVKPYFSTAQSDQDVPADEVIPSGAVIDLTNRLRPDGTLDWDVPAGSWTVMRFGARNNGANSRPAPHAGYGFESDKFSSAALDAHLDEYAAKLLKQVEPRKEGVGWTMMHIDSWEMGSQNWTPKFREEFTRRRGYDPQPWYPAYTGRIVDSPAMTERFLWDLRQTSQELVIENHAGRMKKFAHDNRMSLSIEPYDMNPNADLELGAAADVPMGEFWANTFNSAFSCIEAASIAHTMGRPVVGTESFTAEDVYMLHPTAMKNQLDWAFATGVNRILFHTFQHQPLGPDALPGMMFGPYGVNWHSNQTWWPMVDGVHRYITRASHMLRQGVTVADILYLTPEGAPQVFRAPASALTSDNPILPDRLGYNFDGCAPGILVSRARVKDGRIEFPGGTSYRVLVLPQIETMTPALLAKVEELIKAGATVIGGPPLRSPSLSGYPENDGKVLKTATAIWGATEAPAEIREQSHGKGKIYWGGELRANPTNSTNELYPTYNATARLLRKLSVAENFQSNGSVRYTHRQTAEHDIYFVANRTDRESVVECTFRTDGGSPELWDPMTGGERVLTDFVRKPGIITVPLKFAAHQSFFVVFDRQARGKSSATKRTPSNFVSSQLVMTLDGAWDVSFPPGRGAPEKITLDSLQDWTTRTESGIRYFSGVATYRKSFDLTGSVPDSKAPGALFLELGTVRDICRVRLNGVDLGVVWTAPWRVDISAAVKKSGNQLEIEVANRWPNRLIGDKQPEDIDARTLSWKDGLMAGKTIKTGRYTFSTRNPYKVNSPLLSSGLLGPVSVTANGGK